MCPTVTSSSAAPLYIHIVFQYWMSMTYVTLISSLEVCTVYDVMYLLDSNTFRYVQGGPPLTRLFTSLSEGIRVT
jgi:hypothetical protein